MNIKETTKNKTVSFRIESKLALGLNKLAKIEKTSKSQIIERLIIKELNEENINLSDAISENQINIFDVIK